MLVNFPTATNTCPPLHRSNFGVCVCGGATYWNEDVCKRTKVDWSENKVWWWSLYQVHYIIIFRITVKADIILNVMGNVI